MVQTCVIPQRDPNIPRQVRRMYLVTISEPSKQYHSRIPTSSMQCQNGVGKLKDADFVLDMPVKLPRNSRPRTK